MDIFSKTHLSKLLIDELKKLNSFDEVISIVKSNSKGKIYLIGGSVSRTLASKLYGSKIKSNDFDFIVDILNSNMIVPDGWNVTYKKFGNPTFKKGDVEIDVFPFSDYAYIKNNSLEPNISNFLDGVPFSIQSLAFDIDDELILGEEGIKALKERKFKVHNVISAKEVAKKKKMTINQRMNLKANSMDFDVEPFIE